MKNPDTEAFIGHIVMAMDAMLEYVAGMTLEGFLDDRKTRDAVIRNCEIVGEAIKHIPDEFRNLHPEIDWRGLAGFRDVLIHQYFGVDHVAVWNIVTKECVEYRKVLATLPECPELP